MHALLLLYPQSQAILLTVSLCRAHYKAAVLPAVLTFHCTDTCFNKRGVTLTQTAASLAAETAE